MVDCVALGSCLSIEQLFLLIYYIPMHNCCILFDFSRYSGLMHLSNCEIYIIYNFWGGGRRE